MKTARLQWRKNPRVYKGYEAQTHLGRFGIYLIVQDGKPKTQAIFERIRGEITLIATCNSPQEAANAAHVFYLKLCTTTNNINPQMALELPPRNFPEF